MNEIPSKTISRLQKEYLKIQESPVEYIYAKPLESNILIWHFILTGPPDSPFDKGEYHGQIDFPKGLLSFNLIFYVEYPHKPPSILLYTPNGRFHVEKKICLSNSSFHPETWSPIWYISTFLIGFLSFMLESGNTLGALHSTDEEKRKFARESRAFNRRNKQFVNIFPEIVNPPRPIVKNKSGSKTIVIDEQKPKVVQETLIIDLDSPKPSSSHSKRKRSSSITEVDGVIILD
jgi:ubiquitin-conjugating enzyme E2 J2